MSITTTPGSSAADSFVNVADATTFFAALQVAGAWGNLTEVGDKEKVLKNATTDIGRAMAEHIQNVVVIGQALIWPNWWSDSQGEFVLSLAPDSGTTTGFTCETLANADYPDDYFAGGSVFVKDADDGAPEYELRAVSAFVRSTGTITTAAFTAALANGDTVYLIRPVPRWLKDATCYQALFLLRELRTETGSDHQAGVSSRSDGQGSVSYRDGAEADWLCRETYKLIQPHLPMTVEAGRG